VFDFTSQLVRRGRARPGTRLGADMLFSAAQLRHDLLDERQPAFELYREAVSAYPAGDPSAAVALFEHARRESLRGNTAAAERLLEAFAPWREARWPADLDEVDQHRWAALARRVHRDLPRLEAQLQTANGRFAAAANSLQAVLGDADAHLLGAQRVQLWQQSARLRYRAHDRKGALRAIDEAARVSGDAHTRAELSFWRLFAKHGLLAPDGAPGLTSSWPGQAFEDDLRDFLRTLQDVEGLGTSYLALASTAFTAGRKELALEIYLLALRDPALIERARGDESVWRGLLMAFPAALDLERFDEAENLLGVVERIADQPIGEMNSLRIAVRDARAAKQRREARAAEARRSPAAPARPAATSARTDRSPLGIQTGEGRPQEARLGDEPATAPPARVSWLPFASGGLLLLGVLLLLRRRRRPR